MSKPITVEIVETIRYTLEMDSDDIDAVLDGGEFTYDAVRERAIDVYENHGVDKDPEGYDVRIDFDFEDQDAIADLWAEREAAADEQ